MGDAAGEHDAVHLAADDGGKAGHVLGNLVGHGVVDGGRPLVAVLDALDDLACVIGAQKAQKAAGLAHDAVHLLLAGALGEGHLHDGLGRHVAGAVGREGAGALEDVVGVHHAAVLVAGHGEAAAHVGHDEVALLVAHAQLGGAADGALLLVEAVDVALAVDAGPAGDARHVGELVGVGLVDGVGGLSGGLGKGVQQRGAQDGGAVDAGVHDVLADGVVDGKDAAHGGAHGAAVAAEGVDVLEPDALLGKGVEDGLTAVVKLVRGGVKAGELACGVGDVQAEGAAPVPGPRARRTRVLTPAPRAPCLIAQRARARAGEVGACAHGTGGSQARWCTRSFRLKFGCEKRI